MVIPGFACAGGSGPQNTGLTIAGQVSRRSASERQLKWHLTQEAVGKLTGVEEKV
jgi:hypothetical protein